VYNLLVANFAVGLLFVDLVDDVCICIAAVGDFVCIDGTPEMTSDPSSIYPIRLGRGWPPR